MPNIAARPETVNDRSELGHREADQIIGAHNQSSMLWLTEQATRFSIGITMPEGYRAAAMVGGLVEGLDQIPGHLLRSITFDQGSKWAQWPTITELYGIDCWFCDPYSPWQRGQIVNLNRQLAPPPCSDHWNWPTATSTSTTTGTTSRSSPPDLQAVHVGRQRLIGQPTNDGWATGTAGAEGASAEDAVGDPLPDGTG